MIRKYCIYASKALKWQFWCFYPVFVHEVRFRKSYERRADFGHVSKVIISFLFLCFSSCFFHLFLVMMCKPSILAISKSLRHFGYSSQHMHHFRPKFGGSFCPCTTALALQNALTFYLFFNKKILSGDYITWIYCQMCLDFFSYPYMLKTTVIYRVSHNEDCKVYQLWGVEGSIKEAGESRDLQKKVPGLLDFFSPGTTEPRDLQGL